MIKLTHIVPRLPPSIDGVGDFALRLAEELKNSWKFDNSFLIADPTWDTLSSDLKNISVLSSRSAECLEQELSSSEIVLLHFVGYGYARRGCPHWLVEALEVWKRKSSKVRLISIFHELSASGPIWSSAFWLQNIQRKIIKRVFSLSDISVVSIEDFKTQLESVDLSKKSSIEIRPVFSTVGEPESVLNFSERKNSIMIFGSQASRGRVYGANSNLLSDAIKAFQIEEVLDVGRPLDNSPDEIANVRVKKLGILKEKEISTLLSQTRFGAVEYAPRYLGKSTVFAAYCAYGVCPIVVGAGEHKESADGLSPGLEFINSLEHCYETVASNISLAANTWYRKHPVSSYARFISEYLEKSSTADNLELKRDYQ